MRMNVKISSLSIHYMIKVKYVFHAIKIVKNVKLQAAILVYHVFLVRRLLKNNHRQIIMVNQLTNYKIL